MTSIVDTFRNLLEAFGSIESAYNFFSEVHANSDDNWIQGEQAARGELHQWVKDVEAALELADRRDELRIWRDATQNVESSSIGSVLTTAKRKKALFLQIRTRLYDETLPKPHNDMPECIREDYEEAMGVFKHSARSSAALLRLAVEKLCKELGETGKTINDDIASLVKKGLPTHIQQALDIIRVIGNEAVHPGMIDVRDNPEIAMELFGLLNEIIDDRISKQNRIQARYDSLPQSKLDGIKDRDKDKGA